MPKNSSEKIISDPWGTLPSNPKSRHPSLDANWRLPQWLSNFVVLKENLDFICCILEKQDYVQNRRKWTQQEVCPEFLMCSFCLFKAWDPIFFWASVKAPLSTRSGTMSWWWTTRSRSWPPKPRTCGWAGLPPKGTLPTQEAVRSGVETELETISSPTDSTAFTSGQVSSTPRLPLHVWRKSVALAPCFQKLSVPCIFRYIYSSEIYHGNNEWEC